MFTRTLIMLLSAVGLAGSALAQEKVVVFEFQGIGVGVETATAATQLFRTELASTGKFSVIPKGEVEAKLGQQGITDPSCYAIDCAARYGFAAAADKAVIGTVTRLGERVTLEVTLVSVVRKEAEFTDRFSASSVDDLEPVVRRLAGGMADRKKVESEVTRYAVTEEESRTARRKTTFTTAGIGFGAAFPIGDKSYLGISSIKHFIGIVRHEAGRYVVEMSFGGEWGSGGDKDSVWNYNTYPARREIVDTKHVAIAPLDIGIRYVVDRGGDFAPFFGGGVGMHFIASQDEGGVEYMQGASAFAVHLAGGFYAFQSYDFHVALEARYTNVFTDVFPGTSNSQKFGIGVSLTSKIPEKRGGGGGGCASGRLF